MTIIINPYPRSSIFKLSNFTKVEFVQFIGDMVLGSIFQMTKSNGVNKSRLQVCAGWSCLTFYEKYTEWHKESLWI